MAKTCIFCGGGGPFTKEHVIPEWAAKAMGVRRVRVTPRKLGVLHKPYESVGSFGTTVGSVCESRCNGGWMSELENLAKPILKRMMIPRGVVSVSPDEQVVLASWLWKLAIVIEYPTGAVYFNQGERTCLMDGDAPTPFGVHMWIAAYTGKLDANLNGGPCTFSSPVGDKTEGYLMTMTLRRFAAQLLCVREMPGKSINTESHFNFKGAEVLIWPERDHDVAWPPSAGTLDDALYDKWHTRWNTQQVVATV